MTVLRPFENLDAGGVDSRSNPLNMPRNRALRCLNWAPKQAGYWELRYGYSAITQSAVSPSAISGMFPYRLWDGTKYVVFVQGKSLKAINLATGNVTANTVRGAAIASSAKGMGFFANNRFHYGNGTDQKWFDGTTWRDSGLPTLTLTQIGGVVIVEGVRELTTTEASTISLTHGATGTFGTATQGGYLMYVAMFDTSTNELGPSTISVGSARVVTNSGDKITVGNMLTPPNANWVKLIGGTTDGGNIAFFFTNTSSSISSCSRVGTTLIVVTLTAHGLSTGDVVRISGTTNFDGVYSVSVSTTTKFTVNLPATNTNADTGTVGTVKRIVKAANATSSIDVLAPTQDTTYQVNQALGIPASVVGGAQPGFQFYGAIYNPNGGGHVGNRVALGARFLQTSYRTNVKIVGLPDLTAQDTEWTVLIGRTGDGAQVPYAVADNSGNWSFTAPGQTSVTVTGGTIDGQHELPTRNGVIPSQCNMFCLAGDYLYAGDTSSPTIRRSGSLADDRAGLFTGRPEQSWAPNDIDTFPTGEALTGMFEVDQEVFCGTVHQSALSVNLAGIQQWVGPWDVGIAGRRAGTKCGAWGFFWVSGDKQLCTFQEGLPVTVSDEYELAELAQIGDQYLSAVEVAYYRNASKGKDELRIEGQKSDGTPYTIIHDFKLRDYQAPVSPFGQGYSSQFVGPLASAFTVAQVRDSSGALQVFAGATNGQIYQLYSGANDAGTEYAADLILLVNGGTSRPSVPFFDFYGDQQITVAVGRTMKTSLAAGSEFTFDPPNAENDTTEVPQGFEDQFLYRVKLVPDEVQHMFVRFQLTSHSADGNLSLNSPPHVPLEDYGRLYEIIPSVGDERDR